MNRIICVVLILLSVISLTSCAQDAPSWQEQYDLGVRYLSEGNYDEAIIAFTAAIEIDPKQALAYVGRGDAYTASKKTDPALADYLTAIDLNTALEDVYEKLAELYIQIDDSEHAERILQQGIEATGSVNLQEKILEYHRPTPKEGYPKTERRDDSDGGYSAIEYNAYGNEEKWSRYDASGTRYYYQEHTYDENQCLTQRKDEDWSGGGYSHSISLFSPNGRCIRQEYYYSDIVEIGNYIYSDDSAQVVISYSQTQGSNLEYQLEYVHQMQSPANTVKVEKAGGNSEITAIRVLEFPPENNWEGESMYFKNSQSLMFYFDSSGELIVREQQPCSAEEEGTILRSFLDSYNYEMTQ